MSWVQHVLAVPVHEAIPSRLTIPHVQSPVALIPQVTGRHLQKASPLQQKPLSPNAFAPHVPLKGTALDGRSGPHTQPSFCTQQAPAALLESELELQAPAKLNANATASTILTRFMRAS